MQDILDHAAVTPSSSTSSRSPDRTRPTSTSTSAAVRLHVEHGQRDVTTKTCPIAIQSVAQLTVMRATARRSRSPASTIASPTARASTPRSPTRPTAGRVPVRERRPGRGRSHRPERPDRYRVGTASGSETVGGGDTGPWTFTAEGNEDLTVYMFREPDAPPIATAPVAKFRAGTQYGPAAVRVSWTGVDVATIDHFTLQRSVDSGARRRSSPAPPPPSTPRCRPTTATGSASLATDDTTRRADTRPDRRARSSRSRTRAAASATAGRGPSAVVQLQRRFRPQGLVGRQDRLAVLHGPSRRLGRAAEPDPRQGQGYIDGKYKTTIDLGKTAANRIVQYTTTWSSAGSHKITVKVVGTSGRPRVDLDTFLYLS